MSCKSLEGDYDETKTYSLDENECTYEFTLNSDEDRLYKKQNGYSPNFDRNYTEIIVTVTTDLKVSTASYNENSIDSGWDGEVTFQGQKKIPFSIRSGHGFRLSCIIN